MKICFFINGHEVCIWIPILIDWHWHRPDPEKWIESELIREDLAHELQSLATLHALGHQIGGELGTKVHSLVEAQVNQLKLSEGMKIELSEKAQH